MRLSFQLCWSLGKALSTGEGYDAFPEKEMYKTHEWQHGILHAPVQKCSWQRWLTSHPPAYWEGIMANRKVNITDRGCNPIERAWRSLNSVMSLKHCVTLPLIKVSRCPH